MIEKFDFQQTQRAVLAYTVKFLHLFWFLSLLDMEADSVSIWPRMEPFLLGALQVNILLPPV